MNISVAAFYLLNETAFRVVGVPHEGTITDIIGKGGKVTAEQGIGLFSGEWKTEMFTGLDAVAISDIGIILGLV